MAKSTRLVARKVGGHARPAGFAAVVRLRQIEPRLAARKLPRSASISG